MIEMQGHEILARQGGAVTHLTPRKPVGLPPAVLLWNPKYPHNVGAAIRACSCYGVGQLWYTGNRVSIEAEPGFRLPREERMKGYGDVTVHQYDRPFDMFRGAVPVAIELLPSVESLPAFVHPANAIYVFGPEDGSLPAKVLQHCHRFVAIPSRHCLNLAVAMGTVLYDRQSKLYPDLQLSDVLREERGRVGA